MRMTIAHRSGLGGIDEGLTFDVTTAGLGNEGKRILRFDCFYKNLNGHFKTGHRGSPQNRPTERVFETG
jgi:hypothetical protein